MTSQSFGGSWTNIKLDVIQKYLHAYTNALRKQPFKLLYIDGFAGTGSIKPKQLKQQSLYGFGLFESPEDDKICKDGSAKIALQLKYPFDEYFFIEKNRKRYAELIKLKEEFQALSNRINLINGDANNHICRLCKDTNWQNSRAVMFLDPFGLQVEWNTIVAVANTHAIDMWFLFPLSSVNRMLKRNGDLRKSWEKKLNTVFGTDDWYDIFYTEIKRISLSGEITLNIKKGSFVEIRRYIVSRLKSIFAGVIENPLILTDSGRPLFLLCFAVGNPGAKAKELALKFANHVLKKDFMQWR